MVREGEGRDSSGTTTEGLSEVSIGEGTVTAVPGARPAAVGGAAAAYRTATVVLQAAYRAMAVAVAVPDGAYDAARCFAVAAARAGLVLLAATGGGGR